MRQFLHGIDLTNEWMGKVFSPLIMCLMVVVLFDIFMRIIGHAIIWGFELSGLLLLAIMMLGGGYSLLHEGHIKVDIFYNKFPEKVKAGVDIVTFLFFFALVIVIVVVGGETAWHTIVTGKLSTSQWEYPMWIGYIMVPIGGALLGLQGLAKWIRDWAIAITGKDIYASTVFKKGGGMFAEDE